MVVWFIRLLGDARGSADRGLQERNAIVDDACCPLFGFRSVTQGGVNASGCGRSAWKPRKAHGDSRFGVSEREFLQPLESSDRSPSTLQNWR